MSIPADPHERYAYMEDAYLHHIEEARSAAQHVRDGGPESDIDAQIYLQAAQAHAAIALAIAQGHGLWGEPV